jgi:crotonobetainyl-CoA:carnitine CoA-transferase CaiB-like acyl-CoA transferase
LGNVLRQTSTAFGGLTVEDLVARLESRSVPCGRVRSVADAMSDPQVPAREMLLTLDVPGVRAFRVPGNPVKMSCVSPGPVTCPPRLGEHTASVLASLGYTEKEVDAITGRPVST